MAKGNALDSQTPDAAVLVMLAGNSCAPCYSFSSDSPTGPALTPEDFDEVYQWATAGGAETAGLFFLAPAVGPLNPSIAAVLQAIPDQVVVPLMPADQQESLLGVAPAPDQTVVADKLDQAVSLAQHIGGRPLIIHVQPEGIARVAECLLQMAPDTGHVVLRLDDPHLLQDEDFAQYQRQLEALAVPYLTMNAIGRQHSAGLLDVSALDVRGDRKDTCPVGADFLVLGPDRSIYPCPAYYHAGPEFSLGRVPSVVEDRSRDREPAVLRSSIQGLHECPGCPFLGTRSLAARERISRLLATEHAARQYLVSQASRSGYLLNCLHVLQTRNSEIQSRREGGEEAVLFSSRQMHDVSMDEFRAALRDIEEAAQRACRGRVRPGPGEECLIRWQPVPELPPDSRRAVFRRRVREMIEMLSGLPSADGTGPGDSDAVRSQRVGKG
jgi:radical SAM protein with 4Fe4S-binding SPASM domain